MNTMFDTVVRDDLHRRLKALTPDRKPGWGKFTAPKMVCHLTDGLRMTLGDLAVKPKRTPLRFPVIKQLVVYVLPFPKGVPTAPELLARAPAAWNGEIEALGAMIDRFAGRTPSGAWPAHPALGPLSGRAWGVLTYRHLDHHFRQFGI
jgi:hypothetical protein